MPFAIQIKFYQFSMSIQLCIDREPPNAMHNQQLRVILFGYLDENLLKYNIPCRCKSNRRNKHNCAQKNRIKTFLHNPLMIAPSIESYYKAATRRCTASSNMAKFSALNVDSGSVWCANSCHIARPLT